MSQKSRSDPPLSVEKEPGSSDRDQGSGIGFPVVGIGFPVVGIGASAGGLDVLTRFLDQLPPDGGLAYIIVQHLEPSHNSLLSELLQEHSSMPVLQAAEGMLIQRDQVYVIPAGSYLSVVGTTLHLAKLDAPPGQRMAVDVLLGSMATEFGSRAIAIILSGTGRDGTQGVVAIHENGGFVIVQDPAEAEYGGMPQSAIETGVADVVAPVADMVRLLQTQATSASKSRQTAGRLASGGILSQIIELLKRQTPHDFSLYKPGTLQRRIERRMALTPTPAISMADYLALLRTDLVELNILATDLLINVTGFFRDASVFERLETVIIPEIVRSHDGDRPIRIWVAGCSTGEEAYSLAILFSEAIAAEKRSIKLCVFASDVDPDAVATAREGYYPKTISEDISPDRLARFFTAHEHGYSIVPELRADLVFTIQDLLADPPFSKLDFIACRNVLIYLGPEAQTKLIALFHFALHDSGVLLLGTSETVGSADGLFNPIAKSERIYRRIGKSRSTALQFPSGSGDGLRSLPSRKRLPDDRPPSAVAELCKRILHDSFAPAAVLINRNRDCLYLTGPIERYLRIAPGYPSSDLLAMARPGLRAKLRSALQKLTPKTPHIITAGGRWHHEGRIEPFDLDLRLLVHQGEDLTLVCFVQSQSPTNSVSAKSSTADTTLIHDLHQELETTRADLASAMHDLEAADQEHRVVNEEALSVSEEYQAANEELLTSKEELQSLNEELTALNGQLQETLERQRTTSNDLQNVLYSTKVATLFLDTRLRIRFFTPATKALFNLIPGDIGRPLEDLRALSRDPTLIADAMTVLNDGVVQDREVKVPSECWFIRHILPYRTDGDGVEGVVITFTDITERKSSRAALEAAKREAEQANLAKSRFLAAASHDLRQPLQSLALLQGLLSAKVAEPSAQRLLGRLEQTLNTMSQMLNTMLDINQIEAGVVRAVPVDFIVGDLIDRICSEFIEQAQSQNLELRSVRCSQVIHSDPRVIEQMLRNLVSNALKYTRHGKVLLGCRKRGGLLRIEVWDTGVGIAASHLDAIFDEYHQVNNAARERSLGLGLGLSIVQRLGRLLGHEISVRSQPGRGSVFSIEIALPLGVPAIVAQPKQLTTVVPTSAPFHPNAAVLIVDDDPEVRDLLQQLLNDAGYQTASACDADRAMTVVSEGSFRPQLLLADFNLPGAINGLELATQLRDQCGQSVPVIILTGDISTTTLRLVADRGCVQLNKPVKRETLLDTLETLLVSPVAATRRPDPATATIYVVDDEESVCKTLRDTITAHGYAVQSFADCESFLSSYRAGAKACLLVDAHLPEMSGLDLLQHLRASADPLPAIMITGRGAVSLAVDAMKMGAIDFMEKPFTAQELFAGIERALLLSEDSGQMIEWQAEARLRLAVLTPRQHQVLDMVLAGQPSKNIATDLGISQRTVESHRAAIMRRTGTNSLPALAKLVLVASGQFKRP